MGKTSGKGKQKGGWTNMDRLTQAAYDELEREGMFVSVGEGLIRATDKGIIAQRKIELLLSLKE